MLYSNGRLEAHCPGGGEWNDTILENISKEIKYREVQCTLVTQATQYYLVKLYVGGSDLCGLLINRGLMQPISLQAQQAVLLSMSMQRSNLLPSQAAPTVATGINTYKACTLEPGCQYPVYVSYVNDGPCHFSVQLKQTEEVLVMLMNDINTITLRLLEDVPIPGTICLARCQEDGNICRAVVTNEVDNQFKVFYVDFGNYEVVPLDALYQIPFKYVIPRVMAIRFSLAGVEKSTVTLEMQCAFKQFVDNRLLYMKVLPTPTRMAIPKCELWDPETKTSALDVVNRAAQNAYPEPVSLTRGFSQLVKVSYVYSCSRFYVQLVSKENELLKLMLDLQASCQTNESMDPSTLKVGLPCCALFESDQQWYRSQIVEVLGDTIKVRYIDYGNEEVVPCAQLKIIDGEQLTVLRPQAIECCLNGYQNMDEDLQRDGFLEELILERQFTMKVAEMTNKKALVELFDDSDYNIASLLLDKLASAKSQVSPMLVQAGNKIEHRKSFSNQNGPREQHFRQDRKPGRTNDRNENTWRQDKKDFRTNDRNSNETNNDKNSWRQNNKGFSPNSERFNRDKNRNRNEWNNKENVNTDNWDTANSKPQENDDWGTPANNAGFQNNSRENDFGRNKGSRFNKDSWNSGGQKPGGFKKKNDFRKDGSDISSSGSEKSFQKGPRTSSRNDRPQYQKKFDKPRSAPFASTTQTDDSWDVSVVASVIDAAPATATFVPCEVIGTVSDVIISWFHNPGHFYCQLADVQDQFKNLMTEIQQFYKGRRPESAVVGAPIIGLFPEDNVLYRAQVLEVLSGQYKVYYVDFGNVSSITKIWPIEKKFMSLPAQAIVCSLNEIAPPGDQWPNADNYSTYFDKDRYVCKFVNKDEEKTYVDIFYDNNDVKQLLIQDALAVSTKKIIPDIEIPLLLGQQFRAILKSVNNFSDIIIALECGVALSCKMHNLEEAVTTDENNLKRFLERAVIIYVDNVIDDKLDVTLYDIEGSKIEVLSPDEGACDMVELPCPILILRSALAGYASHVDGMSVFIQPVEYADIVAHLLDQMYESYENTTQDVTIIPEVELLYAVKSDDGNWYRARVINISDTQASVSYIDYGNGEDVDFDKLRQLSDKFLEICILCVQVFTTVATDALLDNDVVASIEYGENGWEGIVELQVPAESSATESAAVDNIDVKGAGIDEALQEPVEVTEQLSTPLENPPEPSLSDTTANVESEAIVQNGIQVIVSHIDSPTEFYLQLSDSLSAIDELQSNLQLQAVDMPVLENPTAGILCAAPFSVDQQWYRAEVLDADDDITTVRFVDYGNTDVISNETTKIKTLPPNLLSLAVYATRSSLKVKSVDGEWSTNATERFEALVGVNNITAEFIDQDEKTNYVELYVNGQNAKDILINENLALPLELSEENKSTCFVSHLNSPSEFWLQLENCVDELEWIAEQLSGAENFPELEDTTPGTLCAALFPDDQMWYRARILSDTVAGLELLFIDYGNSSISSSLRQLPEDLVVTPPLAQKCSLQKPEGIPYWSPQAVNKFNEISADGQTIFTVHKISTGETSVVQLFIEGEDVTSMLLPETEEGCVKDVENLDGFVIEKNGETLAERYKLEPMPGMTWTEESTDKFQELNNQGSKLFQIEFIAENTVRLYADGCDIRPSLGGIKTSSLNMSRTSADDEKTDDEADINAYLNDTIPHNTISEGTCPNNKETEVLEGRMDIPSPQSSSDDIKQILGIITAEDILQENVHERKSDCNKSDAVTDIKLDDERNKTESTSQNDIEEKIESDKVELSKSENSEIVPNSQNEESNRISSESELKEKNPECKTIPESSSENNKNEINELNEEDKTILSKNEVHVISEEIKEDTSQKILKSTESSEKCMSPNENLPSESDRSILDEDTTILPQNDTDAICGEIEEDTCQKLIKSTPESPKEHPTQIELSSEKDILDAKETALPKNEIGVISEKIDEGTCRKLTKSPPESPKKHVSSNEIVSSSKSDKNILDAKDETALPKNEVDEITEEIKEETCPKLIKSAPESPKKRVSINEGDLSSDSLVESEIESVLKDAIEKALLTKDNENISRPVSSCSGKISHDDRIVPAVASRPQSPIQDEDTKSEEKVISRPPSACSGKISHDERIVPAVLSRPQSPIQSDDDVGQDTLNEK
ncbi:maternal protein tudor isoform X2 [Anoplophora glabripennis]|uniref:maternal protein tudor isoform X2 n=1 Tax=Anoplophora glabripennis TaxID=217634 RepID=UPI000875805D|nr:maternal protein tudor isoform X2 [Anoplophora glabripennis]